MKKVQETVAECVREKAEKRVDLPVVNGMQTPLGGMPDRKMLDKVSPDNPVLLRDISGHSTWANSLALEMSGIDKDTPDPKRGALSNVIKDGHPTGVLREAASQLVQVYRKASNSRREQGGFRVGTQ